MVEKNKRTGKGDSDMVTKNIDFSLVQYFYGNIP
jgi:hypothetical protein